MTKIKKYKKVTKMTKNPQKPETYELSKDDQINCLIHIIYGLVGYGAAQKLIEPTYKEYYEQHYGVDSEA